MRKLAFALVLTLCTCFSLSSCAAGPHQLRRSVDDLDHKLYVSSPWLNAALWIVPAFPILHFGAQIGDFLICDAYAFWFKDAWDGKGTGFEHLQVEATDGRMQSLLIDNASFLEIKTQ